MRDTNSKVVRRYAWEVGNAKNTKEFSEVKKKSWKTWCKLEGKFWQPKISNSLSYTLKWKTSLAKLLRFNRISFSNLGKSKSERERKRNKKKTTTDKRSFKYIEQKLKNSRTRERDKEQTKYAL